MSIDSLPAVKVVFINKEELWVEVDKTDVTDEDHAREDAAFWMASRGCIRVQGWGVQGWCVRNARSA